MTFFRTTRGACATCLSSITQSAATQATSFFHGSWMSADGIGHAEQIGMRRRHVEPGGKAGKAGAVLLHVGDRRRRDELGALATEQIGVGDHEVADAALFRELARDPDAISTSVP